MESKSTVKTRPDFRGPPFDLRVRVYGLCGKSVHSDLITVVLRIRSDSNLVYQMIVPRPADSR